MNYFRKNTFRINRNLPTKYPIFPQNFEPYSEYVKSCYKVSKFKLHTPRFDKPMIKLNHTTTGELNPHYYYSKGLVKKFFVIRCDMECYQNPPHFGINVAEHGWYPHSTTYKLSTNFAQHPLSYDLLHL